VAYSGIKLTRVAPLWNLGRRVLTSLQHVYSLEPITALAHYRQAETIGQNELLLVGEGAFLKIYEVKSSKLIAQCRVFNSQTVHGIAVQGDQGSGDGLIAIWGGRSFTLLDDVDLKNIISGDKSSLVSNEKVAPDWLLACAISPFDASGVAFLLQPTAFPYMFYHSMVQSNCLCGASRLPPARFSTLPILSGLQSLQSWLQQARYLEKLKLLP
jgi:hypothetical protein